jgi:phosphopantothenoylcysteine decarboxylase/phosphopantothenate--cysteine ligase
VADFRPSSTAPTKLKKDQGVPVVALEATADVLKGLGSRRRPEQLMIGFAAEHGDRALDYGRGKLERKGLDAVIVNDISEPEIGFDASDNEVVILAADGRVERVSRRAKEQVARAVLDEVERLYQQSKENRGAGADARSAARV